jgi:hypothetical protein
MGIIRAVNSVGFSEEGVSGSDDDFDRDLSPAHALFELNAVAINTAHFVPSTDTVVDDTYKTTLLTDTSGNVRGQIDTGASASFTDQLDFLHDFVQYSDSHPCSLTLQHAVAGSDTTPSGYGYLHVPCPSMPLGYLPIHYYYHPNLRTTVIDERDFARASSIPSED